MDVHELAEVLAQTRQWQTLTTPGDEESYEGRDLSGTVTARVDATGALTTRHPDALASALAKLAEYGRPMQRQNNTMAHMWISDPVKPGILEKLFSTHPPIADRIARLGEIGRTF